MGNPLDIRTLPLEIGVALGKSSINGGACMKGCKQQYQQYNGKKYDSQSRLYDLCFRACSYRLIAVDSWDGSTFTGSSQGETRD